MALDDLTIASAATSVVVAVLALALSVLAWRASRARDNRQLRFVAAAFLVFAAKNVFSAYNVATHLVQHDAIELFLSAFDLALLVLLFLPVFLGRRRRA